MKKSTYVVISILLIMIKKQTNYKNCFRLRVYQEVTPISWQKFQKSRSTKYKLIKVITDLFSEIS